MVNAVEFHSAVVLLSGFPALAGCDLVVEPGELVALRGPNGAGKTTLLRAIAGLTTIESGTAHTLGIDLAHHRRSVRRRVGLLASTTAGYDELSACENVELAARSAGNTVDAAVALRAVGIDGRAAHTALARLSTGQRRRAALAMLVARDPELWLLDEPHAGLDSDGADLIDQLMLDARQRGRTVIASTHDVERCASIGARVVSVVGGRIHPFDGTAIDLASGIGFGSVRPVGAPASRGGPRAS